MPLKNARIHLRVTDEEKQSLVEKATLARQSVSQYILSLSENKTIIVVDGADEVTRQLLKIGNNINQIAIVANTSRKNESELPNYYLKRITDYQNEIMKLPEADQIALDIELYVNGSFNTFSGRTNIHTDNRLLSIDISDMGEQLRPVGLQVILEYIWQRVRDNRNKGIQTWVWVDEFSVMFNDGNGKETVRSADFFQKVFKRIRKYGGIPTGITQNITEVLDSGQAKVMLSNSEFVVLLQQKKTDLDKLIELFNLSPSQSSYLQTGEKGTGLIVSGRKIIPFDRRIPKDSAIYKLCQTDFRREI